MSQGRSSNDEFQEDEFHKIRLIYVKKKKKRGAKYPASIFRILLALAYIWGFVFNEKASQLISINANTQGVNP